MTKPRTSWHWPVLFGALFLLRLPELFAPLLGDEYMQAYFALSRSNFFDFVRAVRFNPHHMLLDPASTWLMARISGNAAVLRLPSLLWSMLTVWGVKLLAEENGAPRLALPAALLLGVSAMHADWACRADFYAALGALSVWQSVYLFRMGRKEGTQWAYALLAIVSLHTHPYAWFILLIHAFYVHTDAEAASWRGRWRLSAAAAVAASVPWLVWSSIGMLKPLPFRQTHSALDVVRFLIFAPQYLAATSETSALGRNSGQGVANSLAALAAAFGLVGVFSRRRAARPPVLRLSRDFVLGGIVLVVISDCLSGMYFAPRQLMIISAFFWLEATNCASALTAGRPQALRTSAFACVVALAALVRAQAARGDLRLSEQLRRTIATVASHCRAGDAFAFDDSLTAAAFTYHVDRAAFAAAPEFRAMPPNGIACGNGRATFVEPQDAPTGAPLWRIQGTYDDFTVESPSDRNLSGPLEN